MSELEIEPKQDETSNIQHRTPNIDKFDGREFYR